MAGFPTPRQGILVTHFVVSSDVGCRRGRAGSPACGRIRCSRTGRVRTRLSAFVFRPELDAALGRVEDELRIDAGPGFGDAGPGGITGPDAGPDGAGLSTAAGYVGQAYPACRCCMYGS
jgi:hypothetical protein